jgi:hypothetical protein
VLEKSILLPKIEFSELLDNIIDPDNRSIIHTHTHQVSLS